MSTESTNYQFPIPTPFGDNNVWGGELNTGLTFFDTYFLALAQNFYGTSAPTIPATGDPASGQFWINTTSSPWILNVYDGSDWLSIGTINPSTHTWTPSSTPNFTLNVQTFTTSGTYTPTTNMVYAWVRLVGGGGGGGGTYTTNSAQASSGGGGGGGGYAEKLFSAATIGASQTVTIGAAGTAGSTGAGTGGTGGTTSLGSLLSATGGSGGVGQNAQSAVGRGGIGGPAGVGSSGNINCYGGPGGCGTQSYLQSGASSGNGGSSVFGGGGVGVTEGSAGNAGTSYGSGGSGSAIGVSSTGMTGGAGAAGVVIVTEYIYS